jgi:hypothetical protein
MEDKYENIDTNKNGNHKNQTEFPCKQWSESIKQT